MKLYDKNGIIIRMIIRMVTVSVIIPVESNFFS